MMLKRTTWLAGLRIRLFQIEVPGKGPLKRGCPARDGMLPAMAGSKAVICHRRIKRSSILQS